MNVTDSQLDTPIDLKDIKINGHTMSFDFVDRDGDTDRFEMEVTGNSSANLQWIDLPKGMKALPIALTR